MPLDEEQTPLLSPEHDQVQPSNQPKKWYLIGSLTALVVLSIFLTGYLVVLPSQIQLKANNAVLKYKSINIKSFTQNGMLLKLDCLQTPPPINIKLKPSVFSVIAERNVTTNSSIKLNLPSRPASLTRLPDWTSSPYGAVERVAVANLNIETLMHAHSPDIHISTLVDQIDFSWLSEMIKEVVRYRNETSSVNVVIASYSWLDIGFGTFLIPIWSRDFVSFNGKFLFNQETRPLASNITDLQYEFPPHFRVNVQGNVNVELPLYFALPFTISLKVSWKKSVILDIVLNKMSSQNGIIDYSVGVTSPDWIRLNACIGEYQVKGKVLVHLHSIQRHGGGELRYIDSFLDNLDQDLLFDFFPPDDVAKFFRLG